MNKTIIKSVSITIFIIALFLGVSYYGLVKYNDIYQRGLQDGSEQFYIEIMDTVGKCQSYSIPYQNQTFNLVLYECIDFEREVSEG